MATEFYVTVEGTKQGRLKGESVAEAHRDKLRGISFHYAVSSPRDAASGQASGKRQHQPVVFVKEWGAASPQLFQALVSNESLKSVLFEFVKTNENGEEVIYHSIKLTSASISAIEQYINGDPEPPPTDPRALEKVSLTFQRIDIENADGKTSATDDLKGGHV
jgi:type VI secretion system secreted protein Hcp